LFANLFGMGKAALAIAEMSQGRLQMMWNYIVHVGLDITCLQMFDQPVAVAIEAQLEHVPVRDDAGRDFLRPKAIRWKDFEIACDQPGARRIHFVEMRELGTQNRRLELVEPAVGSGRLANILVAHTVITQHPQLACDRRVVAHDGAAVATAPEILGWIEAEG